MPSLPRAPLPWLSPEPKITDGLASALDQCLGGPPHLLLQKPDALSPCICLEDFQLEGQGGLPAAQSPTAT